MPRSSISKPTILRVDAVGLLLAQRVGADEVVLLPADDPAQIRFERGRRLVDVVAVEAHAGFEAQRVARAEAARDDVRRPRPASSSACQTRSADCGGTKISKPSSPV